MEVPLKKMKRSKSLSSLSKGVDVLCKYDSGEWGAKSLVDDSGIQTMDGDYSLEKKVDKLNDMCVEQNRAISELAQLVHGSRRRAALDDEQLMDVLGELLQKLIQKRSLKSYQVPIDRDSEDSTRDGGARSLLSAIEARPTLERRISEALTELLQSEDLKQCIVAATSSSIRELIKTLFSTEVSSLYVPIMERAHRTLLKHVTKLVAAAFTDLEENTLCTAEALRVTSSSLQSALQQHQARLEEACADSDTLAQAVASATERVLERELQNWREEISNAFSQASECDSSRVESPSQDPPNETPERAPSTSTGLSAVDRMMIKAEIHKMIREGAVNGAFARALQAMDLELVVTACRAAPPEPALAPHVLLSLLQQLATDLLQDTPLKCTYLEYVLHKIDTSSALTRAHLPIVLSELQRHITSFLHKYPRHALKHRICKIYEMARSLL